MIFGIEQINLSLQQVLSLIGLMQSVFIIVHVIMRTKNIKLPLLTLFYFSILCAAFLLDLVATHIITFIPLYLIIQSFIWFMIAPMSIVFICKLVYPDKNIHNHKVFSILCLPFFGLALALNIANFSPSCHKLLECQIFWDWFFLSGTVVGGLSLLTVWLNSQMLSDMHAQKFAKERYWLILALILMNAALVSIFLFATEMRIYDGDIVILRNIIGLSFIYLSTTSLFRVYPQVVALKPILKKNNLTLNSTEQIHLKKLQHLMELDKVYQEPSYSRSDLAKELDISETALSRIINVYYKKSFPQIMNEYRLEDAKRLLRQTDAPVKTVAAEVGFNSLASFNRVFKTEIGITPSEYRAKTYTN